jgi:hypothetical protein
MMLGLGVLIPVSSVATDAEAAALTASYAAENAGGNGYSAVTTPTLSVGTINSGGFSVLTVLPAGGNNSGYGYTLANGVPSASLLTSLGLSPTQTSFNAAQTIAILNAMQGSTPASGSGNSSAPSACTYNLGSSDTTSCLTLGSMSISTGLAFAVGGGLLLLALAFGGSKP